MVCHYPCTGKEPVAVRINSGTYPVELHLGQKQWTSKSTGAVGPSVQIDSIIIVVVTAVVAVSAVGVDLFAEPGAVSRHRIGQPRPRLMFRVEKLPENGCNKISPKRIAHCHTVEPVPQVAVDQAGVISKKVLIVEVQLSLA